MDNDFEPKLYRLFQKRTPPFLFILFVFALFFSPKTASANIFNIFATAQADTTTDSASSVPLNSQKMPLAEPNVGPDSTSTDLNLSDISISNTTLTPKVGPLGSNLDIADIPLDGGQIGVYTVHAGDTIGDIAQMFGISKATILNANDLKDGQALQQGMILAIPPVSGRIHTVKNGDTVTSIAKKYKVDPVDIAIYNDLEINSDLTPGDTLIIPDSDTNNTPPTSTTTQNQKPVKNKNSSGSNNTHSKDPDAGPITAHPMRVDVKVDLGNALLRPVSIGSSYESQGAHGIFGSAVDLAAPTGTPIMASADGTVVLARDIGWNSGYGEYVIIMSNIDGNIVQTIYAHMSKVLTTAGSQVHRGDIIGKVGRTGNATGPHVHFEVHGALNPLTIDPNYTGE